jgi:hypothetical protein
LYGKCWAFSEDYAWREKVNKETEEYAWLKEVQKCSNDLSGNDLIRITIENCAVVRNAINEGEGEPVIGNLNGKICCYGYQKSKIDDEPCQDCMDCSLNVFYE